MFWASWIRSRPLLFLRIRILRSTSKKKNLHFCCLVTFYDLLSLKAGVNVPTEINKQKTFTLKLFFVVTLKVTDPDPEKTLLRIPDPRSRGQKGTGSRIRIRNTAPDSEPPFPENYVADRIRIRQYEVRIRILLSSRKSSRKKIDCYCFVTSL